jgi:DnaK suppressor protein
MERAIALKFKALFEAERSKLVYSNGIQIDPFLLAKDDMLDEVDMTSSELETSMRMRLRNREALFLKKIEEALTRIAEGRFGDCEECGEAIEVRRLEARPTTTMCVGCKESSERIELLHIDGHRHKSLGRRLRLA